MPTPLPPPSGLRLSRRAALASLVAGAGVGLSGCTPPRRGVDRRRETAPEPVEPEVDPDIEVATAALADQTGMVDLVRATTERHRDLGSLLAPVLAAHTAHADLLAEAVPEPAASPRSGPSPSPSQTVTSPESPTAPARRLQDVPRNRRAALRNLVAAERVLATSTKQHAFRAQSGAFARVLGSMAAAAAQHGAVLEAAERGTS